MEWIEKMCVRNQVDKKEWLMTRLLQVNGI
jgi:hypothetical protein